MKYLATALAKWINTRETTESVAGKLDGGKSFMP
jgi:hypothetical protein